MVQMPSETALLLGLALFALGLVLAWGIGWVQVHELFKGQSKKALAPREDADAVVLALLAVEDTYDKFFDAFAVYLDEDRVEMKGARIAYICDRLGKACEQIEDARQVAGWEKIASPADPEVRAHMLQLIEMVESRDDVVVSGPRLKLDPESTLH
jgi:hypothetical protein